jgi:dTDP-4-amino-4,6-dideoxygalactose transaminase
LSVTGKIPFFRHALDESDIARATDVLRSPYLVTGETVTQFEERFSRYLNISATIGVTSCTAALQLSLLAWNIGPGCEVITTPISFCATANAILHTGAKPVFVDIDPITGLIDPERIEEAITPQTRAIIPVHLYGQLCDMKRIRAIADRHDLIIIEDAAHCVEGRREGIGPGELGDTACFSFHAIKTLTCGEGGAIVTNHEHKVQHLKQLRFHGLSPVPQTDPLLPPRRDMVQLGWKYNMDNVRAALLLGQLQKVDSFLERRQKIAHDYERGIKETKRVRLIKPLTESCHARGLFPVRITEDRNGFIRELAKKGVETQIFFEPIHRHSFYRDLLVGKEPPLHKAERFGGEVVCLPLYPLLDDESVATVIRQVNDMAEMSG